MRILVPFPPWRLLLSAQGLDVSLRELNVFMPIDGPKGDGGGDPDEDFAGNTALLVEGDPYDLQLEPDTRQSGRDLLAPMVPSRLTAVSEVPTGLKLSFAFTEPTADLLAFLHELGGLDGKKSDSPAQGTLFN